MRLWALALALWSVIASGLDRIASEIESRSPATAYALRATAEQLRHTKGR